MLAKTLLERKKSIRYLINPPCNALLLCPSIVVKAKTGRSENEKSCQSPPAEQHHDHALPCAKKTAADQPSDLHRRDPGEGGDHTYGCS